MEDREYCVMECGEDGLEECQENCYNMRLKDLDILLKSIKKNMSYVDNDMVEMDISDDDVAPSVGINARSVSSASRVDCRTLEESRPFIKLVQTSPLLPMSTATALPQVSASLPTRQLVILDPATVNQKATGHIGAVVSSGHVSAVVSPGHVGAVVSPGHVGAVVSSGHVGGVVSSGLVGAVVSSGHVGAAVSSGHVGAVVSSGHVSAVVSAGQPFLTHIAPQQSSTTCSVGATSSASPSTSQTLSTPFHGPRMRFPTLAPKIPTSVQTFSAAAVPQVRILSPQVRVRGSIPVIRLLPSPSQPSPPSPSNKPVRNVFRPPVTNGTAAPARPQVKLQSVHSSSASTHQNQNQSNINLKNLLSSQNILTPQPSVNRVAPASDVPQSIPTSQHSVNSGTKAPDLPLLPETRQETASDARSKVRATVISRKRTTSQTQSSAAPVVPSSDIDDSSSMVDLTQEDSVQTSNQREKTFPSLIVSARASLKIFPAPLINNERLLMDNQIRRLMQLSASSFTEHLLQQRLLKEEQLCKNHRKPLKLGMYSDGSRFASSGGYVWISECCTTGLCSVFTGSIFDRTLQPPTNIMKLMYHWSCNTSVHNVLNWVKVDSYIMKTYYTFFRAVCTLAVQRKFALLGGSFKNIQIGVISIGTYPEGNAKEVKVDIMAVMDPETQHIRLKVLEDFLSDSNKVYESKFRKILEVLREWVHPESTIITDFAVDLDLGRQYGFSNLVVSGGRYSSLNNNGVMDYLRAKVPAMFQNTLGLLSYQIIQQFLDELVWRETWGPFPSRAYENLVKHISELTKLPGLDLITKLKSVAANPSNDWRNPQWKDGNPTATNLPKSKNCETNQEITLESILKSSPKKSFNRPITPLSPLSDPIQDASQNLNADQYVFLESYYYGLVDGNPALQKRCGAFLAECALCKRDFLSASSFSNHLIHHALNDNATLSTLPSDKLVTLCKICLRTFQDRESHVKESHPQSSRQKYWCKICCMNLGSEERLIDHMGYVHQELDMPYKCDLCHYQTSIFETAVAHFKDYHDKDCYLHCPYCFKTVRFCSKSGREIVSNQYYFIQHVQKHSVDKLNRGCEKCCLSFTNMATLKQHQERVHKISGKFLKNVKRIKIHESRMLKIPRPTKPHIAPVLLNETSFHTLKGKALCSSVVVPEYYSVCLCLECDGPMVQNHFSAKMTCTRCSFQSCCANAMREHSARRHYVVDNPAEQRLRSQIIGGSPALDKPLHCAFCTYSSSNGNKMAAHLALCGGVATTDKRKLSAFVHH